MDNTSHLTIAQHQLSSFLLLISAFLFLTSCQPSHHASSKIDLEVEIKELLISNEKQRTAHLTNNALMLVNEIADSLISVQNGNVSVMSNEDIKNRFSSYFETVRYTSWDDVTPPIIHVSEDGTLATVIVQKLIDAQSKTENKEFAEHEYTLFAWTALCKKINGKWEIYSNTSTRKNLTKQEAMAQKVSLSKPYATINEKQLIPEGIAYNNNTGVTYVSSTYLQKIITVSPDGTYSDFKSEQEDGLWSTVGMEVDETNNKFWVVSFNANEVLPLKYPDATNDWKSKIYEYQLPAGILLNIYTPDIEAPYGFNDLCIANSGDVYITESAQNSVYQLNPSSKKFTKLEIKDSLFIFPNGITRSDNDKYLYISNRNGILQYDIDQDSYFYLKSHSGIDPRRLDGLAYYKGTLIGNQPYRNRIIQFDLDEEKGEIESQRILEANHHAFDQPSTGEIAGNSFIYLANAQMASGFQGGKIKPDSALSNIQLLRVNIDY